MSYGPSKQLSTKIFLPPGILPGAKVREILRLCLQDYGWIKPVKCDVPGGWETISPGEQSLSRLLKIYEEKESLLIIGRTHREGFSVLPSPEYGGYLHCWWPTDKMARSTRLREAHVQQVVEVMRLVDSPLAYTATADEETRKTQWERRGSWPGARVVFLDNYSEGLFGLFWRTFLGPPFVHLIRPRLATLPPGTARDLGGDVWLVEPYITPADALTGEGQVRERALIEHLGKECFFDHERQGKPTRPPVLPFFDVEAAWRSHSRSRYEKKYGKGSPRVEIGLKIDEIVRWTNRHELDMPPSILDGMGTWTREHMNDPDFTRVTPEQVFEAVRAQQPLSG